MKFKDFKNTLKTEEYDIPDILSKIKDNLPEVSLKYISKKPTPNYKLRYSLGFLSIFIFVLFIFSSITIPITYDELSGPTELNYFTSESQISNTLKRYNRQKDFYINQSQQLFENYTMADIDISKIYDSNNEVGKIYNEKVYFLNDKELVVYDTSNNNFNVLYKELLNFDESTNVKTMYLVNKHLVIIYNNRNSINVVKYNVDTLHKLFTYTIASTYIDSYVHNNKLYLVSILNNRVLPFIKVNDFRKVKSPTDIGYLENVIGDSYTILTSINLSNNEQEETIFLSFNKWDFVYFNNNNLYLINNHMNYKKNLDYGEYTTVVKFQDTDDKLTYHGSYTVKGSVQSKENVFEDNGNFRMAVEVTHYNIKRFLLFFKKVSEIDYSINVINLRATTKYENPVLELTSNYDINENDDYDSAISILSTTFSKDKVILESRGNSTNVTVLDFVDPENVKTESIFRNRNVYSNVIPLDKTYGFSIRTKRTATGEFEIKFFDLTKDSPVEIEEHYAYLNYSYLLESADYIILNAIEHSNSLYLNSDDKYYYIGFAVQNNLRTNGTYTLIKINKETKVAKFQDLGGNNIVVEKIVSSNTDIIYGLANNHIIRFKLNSFDNYVNIQTLGIK